MDATSPSNSSSDEEDDGTGGSKINRTKESGVLATLMGGMPTKPNIEEVDGG